MPRYDKHRDLEFSLINHVDSWDPPLFLARSSDMELPSGETAHGIHHPVHGVKVKEKSVRVGHECRLLIPVTSKPELYLDANELLFAKLLSN